MRLFVVGFGIQDKIIDLTTEPPCQKEIWALILRFQKTTHVVIMKIDVINMQSTWKLILEINLAILGRIYYFNTFLKIK